MKWLNEKRKIKDLIPASYNPRKLSDKQKKHLTESIEKFDVCDPIVINKNNTVIGGHQRLKVLSEKGINEVDVRVPEKELTVEEEKELNLRLNKNTGEFDFDVLALEFDKDMLLEVGFEDIDKLFNKPTSELDNLEINKIFEVVIKCDSEKHQESIFNRLEKEGLKCRILTL